MNTTTLSLRLTGFSLISLLFIHVSFGQSGSGIDIEGKIYFSHRASEDENIRIAFYDGSLNYFKPRNASSSRGENKPSISPDGKLIAFNTYHFGGWKAAVSNIDGTNVRQVTDSRNYSGFPNFSPDGKWILFYEHENGRSGKRNIFKIRVDGTGRQQLTGNSTHHYFPSMSPDGKKVTFSSAREGGNYEIFIMNSDGTGIRNLTQHANHDSCPSWSPDGKKLAFLSIREGYLNLYTMNADGSGLMNLTNNQEKGSNSFVQTAQSVDELSYMYGTSWSPDGTQIAFIQKSGGFQRLFVIGADGNDLQEVVKTKGNQFNPSWSN